MPHQQPLQILAPAALQRRVLRASGNQRQGPPLPPRGHGRIVRRRYGIVPAIHRRAVGPVPQRVAHDVAELLDPGDARFGRHETRRRCRAGAGVFGAGVFGAADQHRRMDRPGERAVERCPDQRCGPIAASFPGERVAPGGRRRSRLIISNLRLSNSVMQLPQITPLLPRQKRQTQGGTQLQPRSRGGLVAERHQPTFQPRIDLAEGLP